MKPSLLSVLPPWHIAHAGSEAPAPKAPPPGRLDARWVRIVSHSQALTLRDSSRSRSYSCSPTSGIFACAKSFSWKQSAGNSVFLRRCYYCGWAAASDSTPLHKSRHTMTKYLQIARRASEEPPLDTNLFSFPDYAQFRSALLYCLPGTVVFRLSKGRPFFVGGIISSSWSKSKKFTFTNIMTSVVTK